MDWMPEALETIGPCGLAWWQWIGLVLALVPAYLAGRITSFLVQATAQRLTRHTSTTLDDELFARLAGPLRLLGTVAAYRAGVPLIALEAAPEETTFEILIAVFAFGFVWGVLCIIDVVNGRGRARAEARLVQEQNDLELVERVDDALQELQNERRRGLSGGHYSDDGHLRSLFMQEDLTPAPLSLGLPCVA